MLLKLQKRLRHIPMPDIRSSFSPNVTCTPKVNISPLAVSDYHVVEPLIVSRKHLIPVIPVCISRFHAIPLARRLKLYPKPTLLIITHYLQSLHGLFNTEHNFKCRIIYNHTVQMVFMG